MVVKMWFETVFHCPVLIDPSDSIGEIVGFGGDDKLNDDYDVADYMNVIKLCR